MLERFTREARSVVVTAEELSRRTGTHRIDTRHLLARVALTDGPGRSALEATGMNVDSLSGSVTADLSSEGLDASALAAIGIDLAAVRERAETVFGTGALDRPRGRTGRVPFAPDAKKSLELALREAIRLKQARIDTGHLLLGILRADCPGRTALVAAGADPGALRRELESPSAA